MKTCPWCHRLGLLVSRTRRVGFFLYPRRITEYRVRCSNTACGYGPKGEWQSTAQAALQEWDYRPEQDVEPVVGFGAHKFPLHAGQTVRLTPPYAPCGEEKTEFLKYLDSLEITSENIGSIRARLLAPFDCEWNAFIRDETAAREVNAIRPPANETTMAKSVAEAELAMLSRSRDAWKKIACDFADKQVPLEQKVDCMEVMERQFLEEVDRWRVRNEKLKAERDAAAKSAEDNRQAGLKIVRQLHEMMDERDAEKKRADLAENLVKKLTATCTALRADLDAAQKRVNDLENADTTIATLTAQRDRWEAQAKQWESAAKEYKERALRLSYTVEAYETVGKGYPNPSLSQPFYMPDLRAERADLLRRAMDQVFVDSQASYNLWSSLTDGYRTWISELFLGNQPLSSVFRGYVIRVHSTPIIERLLHKNAAGVLPVDVSASPFRLVGMVKPTRGALPYLPGR